MSAFAKCVYLGKQSLQTCFYSDSGYTRLMVEPPAGQLQ